MMYKDYRNKTTTNSMIAYSVIVLLFVIIRILASDYVGLFDGLSETAEYLLNGFAQVGIMFALSVLIFKGCQKVTFKQVFKFYGYKKISWKAILCCFALGAIVYVFNVFVSTFFRTFLESLGYNYSNSGTMESYPFWLFIVNIFTTALLPAICEETAHRGLLLRGLSSYGSRKAIIISSILFGLMHMRIEQFFYTTIIGFVLAYVASYSDSIYPAMIIHFTNNALATTMSFSRINGLGLDFMFTWIDYNLVQNTILALLFIVLLCGLLAILGIKLFNIIVKESLVKRFDGVQVQVMGKVARHNFNEEVKLLTKGAVDLQGGVDALEEIISEMAIENDSSDMIGRALVQEDDEYKPNTLTKVLLVCCFVLMGLVTLSTFIFGVLCI